MPASITTAAAPLPLDLPALDAQALGVAQLLFHDADRAAESAAPGRRAQLALDLASFAEAVGEVRGAYRSAGLVGSQVRADGAVETFVRVQFERGAEDLRVLWKGGRLATVQRGAPAPSYALAAGC